MLKDEYSKAHEEIYGTDDEELKFKNAREELEDKFGSIPIDIT